MIPATNELLKKCADHLDRIMYMAELHEWGENCDAHQGEEAEQCGKCPACEADAFLYEIGYHAPAEP